jgi:hypothetical protein
MISCKFDIYDHLCGLVVKVSGYRSRGLGSIPGATKIFGEVVGLERDPLSLMSTTCLEEIVTDPV